MLQTKGIAKIQEIKTLFQDSWTTPEFFSQHLELVLILIFVILCMFVVAISFIMVGNG